jgi:hypothetical protein
MAAGLDDYWYTRQPTVIALLEAGSWTSEIPWARICDCDDHDNQTSVAIAGSWRTNAPGVHPDGVGAAWYARSDPAAAEGETDVTPLVYEGEKEAETASPEASVCTAARSVVVRAGLGREPDLKPHEVVGWAGRNLFDETGDVVAVARYLGLGQLDRPRG